MLTYRNGARNSVNLYPVKYDFSWYKTQEESIQKEWDRKFIDVILLDRRIEVRNTDKITDFQLRNT